MTKVLVADDSPSMRQMLAHVLREGGYGVALAVDGADALRQLEHEPADVVLTDCHMPGLDGLALTRALRADPRWRHLPVLVLTTEVDAGTKQAGRAAGATGWLAKPFDPSSLLAVIGQVSAMGEPR
ncbi:response regulator [Ramlibacter sp. MMS24-I3-19]|uniref:response regulator n=1 Tax=Ramlibacter sp. MMS24-I3-19 TaxID=3416606 RepID=UPI003CFFD6EC